MRQPAPAPDPNNVAQVSDPGGYFRRESEIPMQHCMGGGGRWVRCGVGAAAGNLFSGCSCTRWLGTLTITTVASDRKE